MARPSFSPSAAQRAQVAAWVQAKVSIQEMATRLDLATKTFRKHFATELGLIPVETVITALETARPRAGGGFRPSDDQREIVVVLAGARWPYDDIALQLDVSREVLEEHFANELRQGPVRFTAPVIRAMWHAAQGGNATAAKMCLIMNGSGAPNPDLQPAREGLTGKKEAAKIAANGAEVGTAWEEVVSPGSKLN